MKRISLIKYLLIASGAVLLITSALNFSKTSTFIEQAISVDGQISGFEKTSRLGSHNYYPIVAFQDSRGQNHQFTSVIGANPPAFLIGERVEVLVREGYTQGFTQTDSQGATLTARLNSFWVLWGSEIILAVTGTILLLGGCGIAFWTHLKSRYVEYLKFQGRPIKAQFIAVEVNNKRKVNGRHPFRIQAMWQDPDSHKVYHFNSDDIWFDPSDYTQDSVKVLIDSHDPRKYHMDLSFLPKKAL